MYRNIRFFSFIVLTLLLLPADAQESLRVIDHGTDGDVRYYSVICPSGQRTSISDYYVEKKICTMLVNGREEVCRTDWDVDTAARQACE